MAARRPRPPALHEDNINESIVSRSWAYNSLSGSMMHKASGMRFSPSNGIQCNGREYKLTAEDIQLEEDAPIGEGACGSVWKGRIKTTGARIALKTVKVGNSDDRKQLLNEVRALIESEGCPYLVQWYAGFSSHANGSVHLVLELMDLGSLAKLQNHVKVFPPGVLANVSSQVLRGLDYLHSHRLLHNDIKPGNVLLNSQGDVKISDFGITKAVDETGCVTCIGTQIYLAPEKCNASSKGVGYSFPSDIWSYGVVLFELASGEHPFAAANSFPAIFKMVTMDPEPRLSVEAEGHPDSLCDFVARCLTRDVEARADAQELLGHHFLEQASQREHLCEWLANLSN